MKNNKYLGKTISVSGGFDPLHIGHLEMFKFAKKLVGEKGKLVVFVNTDSFLKKKKDKAFMKLRDRMRLIKALRGVDLVYPVIDKDTTVRKTLLKYMPDVFANGGDRTKNNIPEFTVCKKLDIEMLFNVGGKKTRSSSELLKNYSKKKSIFSNSKK
ncbi:MAG: adenylyltransferase/cytidyltransferase family protein [bacterium]|nr:adenylyltransferase/cytidyltransferase family protein [bacterium]